MTFLDSLLDAIIRLEGDALVMHVGERPYVVTTSSRLNPLRGPLAWGQVELSSRALTTEAVLAMLGQILPADVRRTLDDIGAIEHQIEGPNAQGFIVIAARGGDDIWVEVRRVPDEAPEEIVLEHVVTDAVEPALTGEAELHAIAQPGQPLAEVTNLEVVEVPGAYGEDNPLAGDAQDEDWQSVSFGEHTVAPVQRPGDTVPPPDAAALEPTPLESGSTRHALTERMAALEAESEAARAAREAELVAHVEATLAERSQALAAQSAAALAAREAELVAATERTLAEKAEALAAESAAALARREAELVTATERTLAEKIAALAAESQAAFASREAEQNEAAERRLAEQAKAFAIRESELVAAAERALAEKAAAFAAESGTAFAMREAEILASAERAVAEKVEAIRRETEAAAAAREAEWRAGAEQRLAAREAELATAAERTLAERAAALARDAEAALASKEAAWTAEAEARLAAREAALFGSAEQSLAERTAALNAAVQAAMAAREAEAERVLAARLEALAAEAEQAQAEREAAWTAAAQARLAAREAELATAADAALAEKTAALAAEAAAALAAKQAELSAALVTREAEVAAAADAALAEKTATLAAEAAAALAAKQAELSAALAAREAEVAAMLAMKEADAAAALAAKEAEVSAALSRKEAEAAAALAAKQAEVSAALASREAEVTAVIAAKEAALAAEAARLAEREAVLASRRAEEPGPVPGADTEAGGAVVLPLSRPALKRQLPLPEMPVSASTEASLVELLRTAAAYRASTVYALVDARPMMRVDNQTTLLASEPHVAAGDVERFIFEFAPHEQVADAAPEWTCTVPDVGRVRCVTFRDQSGAGLIFHLPSPGLSTAEEIGLSRQVQALCDEADGLVVVAGPRSSGKSTLLNAFVDLINRTRYDHVITIESRIRVFHEKRLSFISQREVRGDGEAIAAAARAALREGPDVLVIEDLRAPEALVAALDAARAGRLVFGSISAPTAPVAIERLIDAFPADRRPQIRASLAGVLRAVVAQVLVRKASGGRVPAREVLLSSPTVKKLVLDGVTSQLPIAIESGRGLGMVTMVDALGRLVRDGIVDISEACRAATDRTALLAALERDGVDVSSVERRA